MIITGTGSHPLHQPGHELLLQFPVKLFEHEHGLALFGVIAEQTMVDGDRVLLGLLHQAVLVLLQVLQELRKAVRGP